MQRISPKDASIIDERARALTNLRLSHFKALGASPKPAVKASNLQKQQQQSLSRKQSIAVSPIKLTKPTDAATHLSEPSNKQTKKNNPAVSYYNIACPPTNVLRSSAASTPLRQKTEHLRYSQQLDHIQQLSKLEANDNLLNITSTTDIPINPNQKHRKSVPKVSAFLKYDPMIMEMRVKSLDKRGYLLRDHQKVKSEEKKYLQILKDPKQFSLHNLLEKQKQQQQQDNYHNASNHSKKNPLERRHNSLHSSFVSSSFSTSAKKQGNDILRAIYDTSCLTVPIQFTDQQQHEEIHLTHNSMSEYGSEDDSDEETKFKERLCQEKLNQVAEEDDKINNYGQDLHKYPKLYRYLVRKNSEAMEKRDFTHLQIYHTQENTSKIQDSKNNNNNAGNKKINIRSQSFYQQPSNNQAKIGHTLTRERESQYIQENSLMKKAQNSQIGYSNEQKQQSNSKERIQKTDPDIPYISEFIVSPNDKQHLMKQQSTTEYDRVSYFGKSKLLSMSTNNSYSIQRINTYEDQQRIPSEAEESQYNNNQQYQQQQQCSNKVSGVKKQYKRNIVRETEEQQEQFLNQFQNQYPYVVKKLQDVYRGEHHDKPKIKGYDDCFVPVFETLQRAHQQSHYQ